MDHKIPVKNQDVTPASCSTDLEIAQARWEALVQMIELEEQSRARDVAELRMLIEQSVRGKPDLSASKTAAWSLEGRLQEMMVRIAAQEAQTSQLQAALAAPEKTFKSILDELQATRDEATTALRRTSARLMEDFESKLEALKCLITTVPGQNLDKTQEVQIQGVSLGRRTVSRERVHHRQDSIVASARTLAHTATPPSANISKQAYAHCGQAQTGKKAHSIQVPVPEADGRLVVPPAMPKKQNQTSNIALPPSNYCGCMDGSCTSCAGRNTLGSCPPARPVEAKSIFVDPSRVLAAAPVPSASTSRVMWSPQISCRSVNTPASPIFTSRETTAFAVQPPSPLSRMRNVSPAAFSRPLQEAETYIGTPVVAFPRR